MKFLNIAVRDENPGITIYLQIYLQLLEAKEKC